MSLGSCAAVAVLLLGPPTENADPEVAGPVGASAVVHWRGGAPAATEGPTRDEAPSEDDRRGLREALAQALGVPAEAIVDGALARARVAVSTEFSPGLREVHGEVRRGLDLADEAFRGGRFDDASAAAATVMVTLGTHPELPGVTASAREAHLLQARIAWSRGAAPAAEEALAAALRVDPEAGLSLRQAPPALVERYLELRAELLGTRAEWPKAALGEPWEPDWRVTIDGVPGLRPVPPGEHAVVLSRDGREPVAAWHDFSLGPEWSPPASATPAGAGERIGLGEPHGAAQLEGLCGALATERVVLAARRGARLGVQVYACGEGLGPRWVGAREQLGAGMDAALAGPFGEGGEGNEGSADALGGAWPVSLPAVPPAAVPVVPGEPGQPKPWFRRGWVWAVSVGALGILAGSVSAGVLLSRPAGEPSLKIDAGAFIGP